MSDCCERHVQDVAAAVTEAAGDEPVGFDPASLLTIVLPILTEIGGLVLFAVGSALMGSAAKGTKK